MRRELHWYDFITINIYYFGLTAISQTLAPLVLPLLVQQFVGEARQGTYFGILRLCGLMTALLVQSLMGMLSDRSTLRWGRRRPFILAGTLADLVMIIGIGLSAQMSGMPGFWFLLAMYVLLQASSNTAQSAAQGLIPDLVPEAQRGRFSGVKALMELPLPIIVVSLAIGQIISKGNMWGGLIILIGILLVVTFITMLVPEERLKVTPPPLDWQPFLRLLLMTALFTGIILGLGALARALGASLVEARTMIAQILGMGAIGLVTIGLAVVLGVWVCMRISLGKTQHRDESSFTWWVINRLAFVVGATNLAGFALYFLQGRLGYTRETAAAPASRLMMVVGLFILVSALPAGWLTDRFGRKRMAAVSGIVAACGTLLMLLAPNLVVIYIGGCLIGIATGVFYPASWALGTGLAPKDEAGRYLGLSNLAGAGAGAVGAYIGGPVADFFTTYVPEVPGLGYAVIFAIYGVLFLLSIVTLAKVKEPATAP